MREYYQGVTQDNCGLIKRYDEELTELKVSQRRNADLLKAARSENERLREPLAQVNEYIPSSFNNIALKDRIIN